MLIISKILRKHDLFVIEFVFFFLQRYRLDYNQLQNHSDVLASGVWNVSGCSLFYIVKLYSLLL